jgi:hypothetical protein
MRLHHPLFNATIEISEILIRCKWNAGKKSVEKNRGKDGLNMLSVINLAGLN